MEQEHCLCHITTFISNPFHSTDVSICHFLPSANSLGTQIHTAPSKTSQFITSHSSIASISTPVLIAPGKIIIGRELHPLSKAALKPLLALQCLPPSKVPREMKWRLALWADDPPHYSSDTEHSLPQEKASSLHSYTLSQVISLI